MRLGQETAVRPPRDCDSAAFALLLPRDTNPPAPRAGISAHLSPCRSAAALCSLSSIRSGQAAVAVTGAIPDLVKELRGGSRRGQEAAIGALQALAWRNNENKALIIESGAIGACSMTHSSARHRACCPHTSASMSDIALRTHLR